MSDRAPDNDAACSRTMHLHDADPPIVVVLLMTAALKQAAVFGQCFYHSVAIFPRGFSRLRLFRVRLSVTVKWRRSCGREQNATGRHVVVMHSMSWMH